MRSGLPDERIAARVQHGDDLHGMWQKAVEVCLEPSGSIQPHVRYDLVTGTFQLVQRDAGFTGAGRGAGAGRAR